MVRVCYNIEDKKYLYLKQLEQIIKDLENIKNTMPIDHAPLSDQINGMSESFKELLRNLFFEHFIREIKES